MQDSERTAGDKGGDGVRFERSFRRGGVGRTSPELVGEEKAWIVQESFERGTTVAEVAERHGVSTRQLSKWRKLVRTGRASVAPAPATEEPFATVAVEGAPAHVGSVSIEARGVTVRLDGDVSTVRITSIASALRGIR